MTTSAPTEQRRLSPAVLWGSAVACLAVIALALFLAGSNNARPRNGARPTRIGITRPPKVEHARWRVGKYLAGSVGRTSRAERRRLRTQGPKVGTLVRGLYDTIFLRPDRLRPVVRSTFAPAAARSFLRLRAVGVPAQASRFELLSRRARVGVDARTGARAVASATVQATGRVGRHIFRLVHEGTLWLERSHSRWRIIAYDVTQKPVIR